MDNGITYYYQSGNSVTIYTPTWRVAYYSYPNGELLAWETADRPYSAGESMITENTELDINGKSVLARQENGFRIVVMEESVKLLMMD